MNGYFENNSIYIDLEVSGFFPNSKKTIKALIDTGFSGHLTLSFTDAFPLGLVLAGTTAYTLADGSTVTNFVCLGNLHIDGKNISIPIDIHKAGITLIGTQLLKKIGYNLNIDFAKLQAKLIK